MAHTRRWTSVALCSGLVITAALFHGCGGSSDDDANDGPDASQGGSSSGGAGGTNTGGVGSCSLPGQTCATNGECCSANCDPDLNVCVNAAGNCKSPGASCAAPTECCTGVCDGGVCGSTLCLSDSEACTKDAQCCGGRCDGSTCRPLNAECRTAGNACSEHGQCCSHYCDNGRCSGRPSFCLQTGDACASDTECCGGICTLESGALLGTCAQPEAPGTTGCLIAGQVCGAGATADGGVPTNGAGLPACGGECCSRSCAPYGPTGVLVCQPPSGCRPTGEICINDSDCCGGPGLPGNESVRCSKAPGAAVGRCDNGNACRGSGAVCKLASSSCNAENNCCAGNVNQDPSVCQQDLLGIPRCSGAGDCSAGDSRAGMACASSADCCGLPCLPDLNAGDGDPPFICGPSCVQSGGSCTTDADCCAGLPCLAPPGSTRGTCGRRDDPPDGGAGGGGPDDDCAYYGQQCTVSSDCCNQVPCDNGFCRYAVF